MNAFTQMGMDAFNEGIASGMAPEAAANAAGDAMGAVKSTWVSCRYGCGRGCFRMETFTQALANGAPQLKHSVLQFDVFPQCRLLTLEQCRQCPQR